MMDMPEHHAKLKSFAERIARIYPSISKMIHDYLALINESIVDADTKALEGKILHYLEELLSVEQTEAKFAYEEKLTGVLRNIHQQIKDLKQLEHYIKLAEKRVDKPIIRLIERLDKEMLHLLAEERSIL